MPLLHDEPLNDWEIIIKSGGIHPDRKHKRLITSPKNYIKRERFYSNRIERDISLEELRHILAGEKVVVILGRVVYADIFGIEWETGLCHIYDGKEKTIPQHGGDKYNFRFRRHGDPKRTTPAKRR